MAEIALRGVAHTYDDEHWALAETSLTWRPGVATALLGPSGCGKTTMLNVISGLIAPTRGQTFFDGTDVSAASPQQRNIAQVFQFPVVYDTMTVRENLAFPLRNRGRAPGDTDRRVREIAELLELTDLLPRAAVGLTADFRQRVSLGRGLVREDVAAVLLDEPLTVVDPASRWKLRRQLRVIHEALGLTLVYVTHDQEEALTLADEVLVMNEGRIVQRGTPEALFDDPAHAFVGYFIGSPGMNLLPAEVAADGVRVAGHDVAVEPALLAAARAAEGTLQLGIRPDRARLAAATDPGVLAGMLVRVEDRGSHALARVELDPDHAVVVRLDDAGGLAPGETVHVALPAPWVLLFADEERVR